MFEMGVDTGEQEVGLGSFGTTGWRITILKREILGWMFGSGWKMWNAGSGLWME